MMYKLIDMTGYSYFGARYYDSDLSIWLSVDPLADKYPSMSPYMYCAGNPVMLVDPDGRAFRPLNPETAQLFNEAGVSIFKKQKIFNHFIKTSTLGNFYSRKENLTFKQFKKELKSANKQLDKNERVKFTKQEIKDAYSFYSKVDAKRLDDIVLLSANSTNNNSDFYNGNQMTNTARMGINSRGISNVSSTLQGIENFVENVTPEINNKYGQRQNLKTQMNFALKREFLMNETRNSGSRTYLDNGILIDGTNSSNKENIQKLVNELIR